MQVRVTAIVHACGAGPTHLPTGWPYLRGEKMRVWSLLTVALHPTPAKRSFNNSLPSCTPHSQLLPQYLKSSSSKRSSKWLAHCRLHLWPSLPQLCSPRAPTSSALSFTTNDSSWMHTSLNTLLHFSGGIWSHSMSSPNEASRIVTQASELDTFVGHAISQQ